MISNPVLVKSGGTNLEKVTMTVTGGAQPRVHLANGENTVISADGEYQILKNSIFLIRTSYLEIAYWECIGLGGNAVMATGNCSVDMEGK